MISRSFVIFFALATDLYLVDVFLAAYAKNNLPLYVWEKIYATFGMERLGTIYLGSVLDALVLSTVLGYGFAKVRSRLKFGQR